MLIQEITKECATDFQMAAAAILKISEKCCYLAIYQPISLNFDTQTK
jgi:hypothetical protein